MLEKCLVTFIVTPVEVVPNFVHDDLKHVGRFFLIRLKWILTGVVAHRLDDRHWIYEHTVTIRPVGVSKINTKIKFVY